MNVQTYLFFDGRCEEAIEFYKAVFGADLLYSMRFREGPPNLVTAENEEKIFHATMRFGETVINLSDDLKQERGSFGGFAILAHLDNDASAEEAFESLQEGGRVGMPIQEVFWASRYGIVTDRFGVTWKIQAGQPKD